ncbi:hypothetical protein HZC30_05545 [Candidatus Woesearchaeota archaeon]|nr:hypothetical protein [Candidatus Woesearchaeota archaeon]
MMRTETEHWWMQAKRDLVTAGKKRRRKDILWFTWVTLLGSPLHFYQN